MTLEDFRDVLRHSLDAPGMHPDRLDRFVNQAYFEVVTKGRFKKLLKSDTLNTVSGTRIYGLPTRALAISFMVDTTNKRRLLQDSLEHIHLRDYQTSTTGAPRYWAQDATALYLSPTPDAAYALTRFYFEEPSALSSATQTTVLDNSLDVVIEAFARYFALQSMGHSDQARNWMLRGQAMLNAHTDLYEREFDEPGLYNTEVAYEESDLTEWR